MVSLLSFSLTSPSTWTQLVVVIVSSCSTTPFHHHFRHLSWTLLTHRRTSIFSPKMPSQNNSKIDQNPLQIGAKQTPKDSRNGGFNTVYKDEFKGNSVVAVKRMNRVFYKLLRSVSKMALSLFFSLTDTRIRDHQRAHRWESWTFSWLVSLPYLGWFNTFIFILF